MAPPLREGRPLHKLVSDPAPQRVHRGLGSIAANLQRREERERIAESIGTVREVVSRRLSALVESGHLQIDGRRLALLKPLK